MPYRNFCNWRGLHPGQDATKGIPADIPPNLIIIISPPRCGSTWYGNILRCHPNIDFAKSSSVFQYLGFLYNRRYPLHLSNLEGNTFPIEATSRGTIEYIPLSEKACPSLMGLPTFALEKIHPEFYQFNTEKFIYQLGSLINSGVRIKMLYLAREPRDAISSFISYKTRSPEWYRHLDNTEVLSYYRDSLKALNELQQEMPGYYCSYDSLKRDFEAAVSGALDFIFDTTPGDGTVNADIVSVARKLTSREILQHKSKSFFGNKEGKPEDSVFDDIEKLLEDNAEVLNECNNYYRLICGERPL